MTEAVVPGQILTLVQKSTGNGSEIHRFSAGRGAVRNTVAVDNKTVPVIVASTLGKQVIQEIVEEQSTEKDESTKPSKNFIVSVVSPNDYTDFAKEIDAPKESVTSATATNLPREGDIVLVRVVRLNSKQATCDVLCVEGAGNVSSDGGAGSNGTSANFSVPMGGGSQLLSSYGAVASFQGSMAGAQPMDVGEAFRGVIRTQDIRSTERDKVKIVECFRPGDIVRAMVLSLGDGSNYYLTTARNDLGVVFARSEGGAGDQMVAIDWETMVCERTGAMEKRKCAKLFN